MSSYHVIVVLAAIACFSGGFGAGIGLAVAKPGKIRDLARRMGRPDYNKEWYYNQTMNFHRRIDACVPAGAVIFVGDSFIQGMCVTEVVPGGINYGIGADTTEGVLKRLPSYHSISRASAFVLAIGDADLRRGRAELVIVENYKAILAGIPQKVVFLFCSLTPYSEGGDNGQANKRNVSLNRLAAGLCASRPNCYFVDLYGKLADNRGYLRPEFDDDGGGHLNGEGYRVCIEELRGSLESLSAREAKIAGCAMGSV